MDLMDPDSQQLTTASIWEIAIANISLAAIQFGKKKNPSTYFVLILTSPRR